jgi:hypothetical protein
VQPSRNFNGVHCRINCQNGDGKNVMMGQTLAKQKFTMAYKKRPKSSLRMRMAVSRLPRTSAEV